MAVTSRRIYDTPSGQLIMVVKGSVTIPTAVGNSDDPLILVSDPKQVSLMLLDGHAWSDVSGGTFGTGTVSSGIVVKPIDSALSESTIAGLQSAIAAAGQANDHIPDIDAVPTGFPAKLTGLASAGTASDLGKFFSLSLGVAGMVPNFRYRTQAALTASPTGVYEVHLRFVKGYIN